MRDRTIVLLGQPGAGKGTQASRLANALGIAHVATGDLIRSTIRTDGPYAAALRERLEKGELVADRLIFDLLLARLRLDDARHGFVLDGFPRTRAQAETLDAERTRQGAAPTTAVHLEVAVAVLIARLSGRRVCVASGHPYHLTDQPPREPGRCDIDGSPLEERVDDRPTIVEQRLRSQRDHLEDVLDFFRRRGRLHVVDGDAPPTQVASAIRSAIDPASSVPEWVSAEHGWILGHIPPGEVSGST